MEHLAFANPEKRVLLAYDDLLVLAHRGCEHYGITYCRKDTRSTGQIMRLLILL